MGVDTKKIKSLREGKNLTQEEAAVASGLKSKQQWNQIETGQRKNITLATLEKVADVLGVKAKDLLK
jgi:transcriptional regulator with XRE-family HTH domain